MRRVTLGKFKKFIMVALASISITLMLSGCDIEDCFDSPSNVIASRVNANIAILNKLKDNGILTEAQLKVFTDNANAVIDKWNKADSKTILNLCSGSITTIQAKQKYNELKEQGINVSKSYPKLATLKDYEGKNIEGTSITLEVAKDPSPISLIVDDSAATLQEIFNRNIYILKGSKETDITKLANEIALYQAHSITEDDLKSKLSLYFKDSGEKLLDSTNIVAETTLGSDKDEEIGKDLWFKSNDVPTLSLRIKELNKSELDRLELGDGEVNKYMTIGGNIYLMEYPAYYISKFKTEGSDYSAVLEESDYMVNLLDQTVKNKNGETLTNWDTVLSVGAVSEKRVASFTLDNGDGGCSYTGIGRNNATVDGCTRVVLNTYLEYLLMPGIVDNENFVALGRKVRITNFRGNVQGDNVADNILVGQYVDDKGNFIEECGNVTLGMFIDKSSTNENIRLAVNKEEDTVESEDTSNDTGYTSDKGQTMLPSKYKKEIDVGYKFPSSLIASEDVSGVVDNKMFMYGLCMVTDMYNTALYSRWITDTTSENGNLASWNQWLAKNQYKYTINLTRLEDYLGENYSYELSKDGTLVLNLNTLVLLQEDLNKSHTANIAKWVRTISVIIGVILINYGMLILAAWRLDTLFGFSIELLSIITFGKWVACTDNELGKDSKGRTYKSLRAVLVDMTVFTMLGVSLCTIDVLAIVQKILSVSGGIIKAFGSILRKVR